MLAVREMRVPKPHTHRSKQYLEYIRTMRCLVCQRSGQAHHVGGPESGRGYAHKGSDYRTIPLCYEHHYELHDDGRETFCIRYGLDLNLRMIKLMEDRIVELEAKLAKPKLGRPKKGGGNGSNATK